MSNPLIEVQEHGQSIWYDFISRDLLLSGELRRLVEAEGVRGVTSNPAIFEKAIAGSMDYDAAIAALAAAGEKEPKAIFEKLAIHDIQMGCDVLRPVYDGSQGHDGFVSLEVSPQLAFDTPETIAEAKRLWASVGRPNLMIKVPATKEGLPAIEELIASGINVNATLLFSVAYYEGVHEAYIRGLERWVEGGGQPGQVASVASFFVSRIDAMVEKQVRQLLEEPDTDSDRQARLESLNARIAIANAVDAYGCFRTTLESDRWKALADRGARPQRVLWASTGTKSPELPKTLYVDALIGPDTVNTVPAATFEAFREEGQAQNILGEGGQTLIDDSRALLKELEEHGISLDEITDELLIQGCQAFCDAFDQLLDAVAKKRDKLATRA
ncbi:MAG: transaldolase [Myxococcota bacterium]|nr:transaldolase [Myxococcota bacterium]